MRNSIDGITCVGYAEYPRKSDGSLSIKGQSVQGFSEKVAFIDLTKIANRSAWPSAARMKKTLYCRTLAAKVWRWWSPNSARRVGKRTDLPHL